jgi:hypothetical protein
MVSLTSLILGALALAAAPAACETTTTTAGTGVRAAVMGGGDCLAGMRTFDCGARFVHGRNRGQARCVKVRGKDVTTDIACALIAMGKAAESESGQPFRVNSGFRTNAHQALLAQDRAARPLEPPVRDRGRHLRARVPAALQVARRQRDPLRLCPLRRHRGLAL